MEVKIPPINFPFVETVYGTVFNIRTLDSGEEPLQVSFFETKISADEINSKRRVTVRKFSVLILLKIFHNSYSCKDLNLILE